MSAAVCAKHDQINISLVNCLLNGRPNANSPRHRRIVGDSGELKIDLRQFSIGKLLIGTDRFQTSLRNHRCQYMEGVQSGAIVARYCDGEGQCSLGSFRKIGQIKNTLQSNPRTLCDSCHVSPFNASAPTITQKSWRDPLIESVIDITYLRDELPYSPNA